ncbi:hypothetical protein Bcep1808_1266 [Burkholderia vietnamiensis G4]|uniref:Uncharacterized protein n=1 Tax=Burkholderia vietnamiensis (strain G4 / LMG 22486) TaxID=269482 RepID=A4JDC3_BURVG|nr:hypothetical protein Bcep1808_1266 [Burkholderia vietnamiensis G4]
MSKPPRKINRRHVPRKKWRSDRSRDQLRPKERHNQSDMGHPYPTRSSLLSQCPTTNQHRCRDMMRQKRLAVLLTKDSYVK